MKYLSTRERILVSLLFLAGCVLVSIIGTEFYIETINAQTDAKIADVRKQLSYDIDKALEQQKFGSINTVAGIPYYLFGSGVGSSDTSITLTKFQQPVSNYPLRMADFGSIGYLTLEPGNVTRQEFISFTGIVQNADLTATLTGVERGLAFVSPYTASSTLRKAHGGGTVAVISNPPQLYEQLVSKYNSGTSSAVLTFSSTTPPRLDAPGAQANGSPIATTSELVSWAGLVAVTTAGAPNATQSIKGIVQIGTGAQMASTTALGSTGASLIGDGSTATSTCAVAGSWSLWSMPNGKLSQSCMDLAKSFTFTGGITSTAATSTFGRVAFGAFTYVFPTASMSTSSVFAVATSTVSNSSQTYLMPMNVNRTLEATTTTRTFNSSNAEQVLFGTYIPSDTLTPGSSDQQYGNVTLHLKLYISDLRCAGSGNFHAYVYLGSLTTPVAGGDMLCSNTANTGGYLESYVTATSSLNARGNLLLHTTFSSGQGDPVSSFDLNSTTTPANTTANSSGYITTNTNSAQQFRVTVKFDTSNAGNTVTVPMGILEVLKP